MADPARPRPREPLFLERQTYRRRRLMDGARVLPVVGAAFFLLPVLWAGPGGEGAARTAAGGIYVFLIWLVLIGGAALISRRLIRSHEPPTGPAPDEGAR
jgi:hypothetical protein